MSTVLNMWSIFQIIADEMREERYQIEFHGLGVEDGRIVYNLEVTDKQFSGNVAWLKLPMGSFGIFPKNDPFVELLRESMRELENVLKKER